MTRLKGEGWSVLLAIGTVYVVLCLFASADRSLWETENRYAEVAVEMTASGEFFVPRLFGELYTDKPPLYFWSMLLTKAVLGRLDTLSAVIPCTLSAIVLAILCWTMAEKFYEHKTAFYSVIVLSSSIGLVLLSLACRMDTMMTAFITASFLSFHFGFREGGSIVWRLLFWVFLALGVLAKGPYGVLIPGIAVLIYGVLTRRKLVFRVWEIVAGALCFAIIVGGWLAGAIHDAGLQYLGLLVRKQMLGRAYNSWTHPYPVYWYLWLFPASIAPWTGFLPAALWQIRKEKRESNRDNTLLLAVWLFSGFALISIVSCKHISYVLPLFPPTAVLMGRFLSTSTSSPSGRRLYGVGIGLFSTIMLLVAVVSFLKARTSKSPAELRYSIQSASVVLVVVAVVSLAVGLLATVRTTIVTYSSLTLGFLLFAIVTIVPKLERIRPFRDIGRAVRQILPEGQPLFIYRMRTRSFAFYPATRLVSELKKIEELKRQLQLHPRAVLIIKRKHYGRFRRELPRLSICASFNTKWGELLIVRQVLPHK